MKQLLSLLLCTILTVTAFGQSEPITTLKGQSSSTKFASPKLVVPYNQATKTSEGGLIETGNNNLLANPSFEHQIVGNGWTAINGSCAASSGVTVDGLKNCLFTSSGTNWSLSQCSTTNAPRLAGQEMENSVWLGSASTTDPIWVCPGTNGSYPTPSVANGCMQYTNIGNIQQVKNYFLGDSASTSNCIRISGSNSGTTVGIDKAYTGLRTTSEVSGELNTPWVPCTFSTLAWQGLGTVTNNLQCRRNGPKLEIRGNFVTGITSANIAQIPLPTNYGTITTTSVASGESLGTILRNTATNNVLNAIASNGSTFFNVSNYVLTNSAVVAVNGNTAFTTGDAGVFQNISIAISEWKNNINAFSTKCDDPRQCETVFSAIISSVGSITTQSTGTNYPWLSGCSVSSGLFTCSFSGLNLTSAMSCNLHISDGSNGWSPINSQSTSSVSFTPTNSSGAAAARGVNLICQKQGADYDRSRITQQIVQMREVPRTPGAIRTDIFGVRYTGGGASTPCTTVGNCTLSNPIGNIIASIAKTATGVYLVTFSKNYINVSCTYTPTGATNYLGGQLNAFTSGTNTLSIQSGISTTPTDSFGTINCIGEY